MPYTEEELGQALINADKAGDTIAAKTFALEIQKMRAVADQAASLNPEDAEIARTKNTPLGAFLREQAAKPKEGETPEQTFRRQYGGLSMPKPANQVEGLGRSYLQGSTFALGDEAVAAGAAALNQLTGRDQGRSFDELYSAYLGRERDKIDAYRKSDPAKAFMSELSGALTSPVNFVMPANTATTLGGKVAQGAAQGAGMGAAYGFGSGEGEANRAGKAAWGAAIGAPTGAATGYIADRLTRTVANPPTAAQLRAQANAAYDAAENAGVVISRDSWQRMAQDIQRQMAEEGIDATLHPRALAALNRLTGVDDNITLNGAEILRRVARNAASSNDASERRLASIMIDHLDDYIGGLGPRDVIMGNAGAATDALATARGLWSRARKGEIIDNLIERAQDRASQFSGSGYENALRTEFRGLLRNMRAMRGFTQEEQAAIRHVARGGPIENALRMLGKFAPTGVVSSALSSGTGFAAGGPAGAVALPAAGFGARRLATAMTERNAQIASDLMRNGAPLVTNRALTPIEAQLMQLLTAESATQTPRVFPGP